MMMMIWYANGIDDTLCGTFGKLLQSYLFIYFSSYEQRQEDRKGATFWCQCTRPLKSVRWFLINFQCVHHQSWIPSFWYLNFRCGYNQITETWVLSNWYWPISNFHKFVRCEFGCTLFGSMCAVRYGESHVIWLITTDNGRTCEQISLREKLKHQICNEVEQQQQQQ